MGIIKRSIVSIVQRFWKSLILLLVVFILGNVIAASVTVRDATENVEQSMKERLGAYVDVDMNQEYFMKGGTDSNEFKFKTALADEMGSSEHVREYSYSLQTSVGGDNLKKYESEGNNMMIQGFGEGMDNLFDFGLVSDKNGEPSDAKNGKIEIVDGRFPSKEDGTKNPYVLTISEEVAKLNNLKVGDKVKLTSGVIDYGKPGSMVAGSNEMKVLEKITKEFEIIGVFKTKTSNSSDQMEQMMEMFSKNNFYTSLEAGLELDLEAAKVQQKANGGEVDDYTANITPTYLLKSVDDLDPFMEEYEHLLPEAYKFNSSKDSYQNVASSITNMNNLANNVYIFGIIVAIIILTLVIVIFLRERKTEFGIYQALGESRVKTMGQIAIEMFIVTVMGVSLSVFSGNYIAQKVSTQMVETQLLADEENQQNGMMGMAVSIGGNQVEMPSITKEEVMESYQVEMTLEYIASFYGVMLGSASVATLASMIYILRLKPREILL